MAAMNSVVGSRVAQGSTFIPRISLQDRCFFGTSAGFSPCSVRGTHSAGSIRRKSADKHFSLRVNAVAVEPMKTTQKTKLHDLWDSQKQSPWYDNLQRPVQELLQKKYDVGIRGVTSNPTIFQKAIMGSDLYDEQFGNAIKAGKSVEDAFWEVVFTDIQAACDVFLPIYNESDAVDGYVSVEVSPNLAHEGPATVDAAKMIHGKVQRKNVYIKIPATTECIPAIEEVIAAGISVNVTLILSASRYEEVMEAYLKGLEKAKGDLSKVSSVASFFVSRVDVLVDKQLEALGTDEAKALLGKAAVSQSKMAYKSYKEKFSGPRWEALVKRGAKKQRLLLASTGAKNPNYPDTIYIDSLIGPETVNTMPDAAIKAFIDHGTVARTIDADMEETLRAYNKIEKLGITWAATGAQLEEEGVESFRKSFLDVLADLQKKAEALKN